MKKRKFIIRILIFALMLLWVGINSQTNTYAKSKAPCLSKQKITVKVGKTKGIKLKNVSRKVKWKVVSGKKNIQVIEKTGKYKNAIIIKGKKNGKATLKAVYDKKTYKVKVTVKKNTGGKKKTKPDESTPSPIILEKPIEPEVKYATITFDTGEGTPVESIKRKIGEPYGELPTSKLKGCYLQCWSMNGYYGNPVFSTDICKGDIILYASFRAYGNIGVAEHAKVYLEANGGTGVEEFCRAKFEENFGELAEEETINSCLFIKLGEEVGELPKPVKEGFEFIGWYADRDCQYKIDSHFVCKGNIKFYAKYEHVGDEVRK